ncbi:hypothetical protein [Mycobacterium neglectum]|uniref:hypothetical protein n=1 Tax=Mycobacterium neglectum TaxID=242737 RepID=UPI001145F0E7|nr:hypothetical protein [Mycobacterium neglectum]
MARKTLTQEVAWRFFYLPLIIGLMIGAGIASATGQWWWAAIGTVCGAAMGEAVRRFRHSGGAGEDQSRRIPPVSGSTDTPESS